MNRKTLYIKNMVCARCIKVVKDELEKLYLNVDRIILGEVDVSSNKKIDEDKIREVLEQNGFKLIDDKQSKIVEKIKVIVIILIRVVNNFLKFSPSNNIRLATIRQDQYW